MPSFMVYIKKCYLCYYDILMSFCHPNKRLGICMQMGRCEDILVNVLKQSIHQPHKGSPTISYFNYNFKSLKRICTQ